MPNWVKTGLKFSGSDEDFNKLKELVVTEDNQFDFRKIVPYPSEEELKKTRFYIPDSDIEVDKSGKRFCKKESIFLPEEAPNLNWYEWQRAMWGTKWNACEAEWDGDTVWLETAWSFCKPIVLELSKKFPDLTIEFRYADEDIGSNCDYGWCRNGKMISANIEGEIATKFAIDIWGREDEYEFRNGEWRYIE